MVFNVPGGVRVVVTKTPLAALWGGLAHPGKMGAPRDGSLLIPGMNSKCFYPSKMWSRSLLQCLSGSFSFLEQLPLEQLSHPGAFL